ncbi:MAG: alpha/beta hydrolase [Acidimicrobiia bacterium]|nr:alpha/beta hydrolase [Acidimicrobiia bacterium]
MSGRYRPRRALRDHGIATNGVEVVHRRRRMLATVAVLGAVAVLGLAGLWILQRRLIYFPEQEVPPVAAILPTARSVPVATTDGLVLTGWFLPAVQPRAAVLVFNGNAGNRAHRVLLARALADRGLSVLLFDYRGYGGNPGAPSEEGLATDAAAAAATLADLSGGKPLVFFGESLGAAVAARLAVESPPSALVLRSPFTPLADVAAVHYPLVPARLLLRDRFETLEAVRQVEVPVLVVAGSADAVVPADLPPVGRALSAFATSSGRDC